MSEEEKVFWNKLAKDKELYIVELKSLIKTHLK
jgi:hypothetical protein